MQTSQASYPRKIEKGMKFRNLQENHKASWNSIIALSWPYNGSNCLSVVIAFPGRS